MENGESKHPSRKYPAHWTPIERHNKPVIIFLTVCSKNREPILANPTMFEWLNIAWEKSQQWNVGRYLIMPNHIHLFCTPAVHEAECVTKWVSYWKRLVSVQHSKWLEGRWSQRPESARAAAGPPEYPLEGRRPRRPSLWQKDCWDTQLRRAESYREKWEYVRQNPVRAKLVTNPDDWPYQGVLNTLRW